jgi:hypothetical protein
VRQWLCKQRGQLCSFIHTYIQQEEKGGGEEKKGERRDKKRREKRPK